MQDKLGRNGRDTPAVSSPMSALTLLESRRDDLMSWLAENGMVCEREQRHLDDGTEARTYWHFGYLMAVKDVLALLGNTSTSRH